MYSNKPSYVGTVMLRLIRLLNLSVVDKVTRPMGSIRGRGKGIIASSKPPDWLWGPPSLQFGG